MSSLVEAILLVLALLLAVGLVLCVLQLRQMNEWLEAINHALERLAVELKKR